MSAIVDIVIIILQALQLVLFIRIILSWFPGINWSAGFFRMLDDITEPILLPFRKIIPPIGGMLDISPIVPLILINFLISFLAPMGSSGGYYF
ncbi:MAG: YggT family protein [Cyanobacteriota bacterium]